MNYNEQINKINTFVEQAKSVERLRSTSLTVSERDFQKVFGLNDQWQPLQYIQHEYEVHGDVVVDHATGLAWQKLGSAEYRRFMNYEVVVHYMIYQFVQKYIEQLNCQKFAGYTDWRLPTISELMSLLEPTKKNGDLYIDRVFDTVIDNCWSADLTPAEEGGSAWYVKFLYGGVSFCSLHSGHCVRAVRSL